MAITKIGAPLTGIRGTVGGITYSENKAGTYAKQWSPPSNPRTPKQTIERGYLSRMPALWTALTGVQRAAWDTFAALGAQVLVNSLGENYYISGYGWFCKCTIRLFRVGRASIATPPAKARPAAPTIDDFRVCVAGTESDICAGGVASASTQDPIKVAAKAFDDSLAGGDQWQTLWGNTTGWLRYDLAGAANVKRYRIYIFDFTATTNAKDWTFQVWSAAAWQTIHTVSGFAPTQNGWYDFYCPNAYTETDYRINVTANDGHANALLICEMEYYLADVDASVVCFPEDEFDAIDVWDLILHISQGQTIGKAVQYPGFYEILATQTSGRWFHTFQAELDDVFGAISMERSWFAHLYRQSDEGIRSAPQAATTITIGG